MRRTVTWILYIFMGIQIAFGCVYVAANFGAEQQFQENMFSFLPAGAVYLLQLIAAVVSTWYVLGKLGFRNNKYLRGYVCAFLLTVPYLLQMHMARLVWSVSLSLFLWLFGMALETMKSGFTQKRAALLLTVYILYGVICPDGVWTGSILMLGLLLFKKRQIPGEKSEKREGRISGNIGFLLAVFAAAGVIFGINTRLDDAFLQERSIYRENKLGMAAVSRFVWPNFGKNYYFWPEEVKAELSIDDAVEISIWADEVAEKFYIPLEETYGKKEAVRMCLYMARSCLEYRTKETVAEIGQDFVDYLLLPFTIERNLKGEGISLTAWNYGRMRAQSPVLVKYYYRYGIFELPILLLGSVLLWGMQGSSRTREWRRRESSAQKYILFMLFFFTVWYTVRSNFPIDYKRALPILFFWYFASAGGLLCQRAEN